MVLFRFFLANPCGSGSSFPLFCLRQKQLHCDPFRIKAFVPIKDLPAPQIFNTNILLKFKLHVSKRGIKTVVKKMNTYNYTCHCNISTAQLKCKQTKYYKTKCVHLATRFYFCNNEQGQYSIFLCLL
jgi:hypothetical protein